jgi:hypothetical protein
MSIIKISFITISICLILSCANNLTLSKISTLRKNITEQEVNSIIQTESKYEFSIQIDSSKEIINVKTYILSSGSYDSNYLLCFKENKLYFWGYPHEFSRSNDKIINEIGKKSVEKINELDKIKR